MSAATTEGAAPLAPRAEPASTGRARWIEAACVTSLTAGAIFVWVTRISIRSSEVVGLSDVFGYFLRAYQYEAERLATGTLPFWNPYQGGGVPFLATLQPGALYPPRLLLLAVAPPTAMAVSTFGHILLSLLGTYVFCRRLGTSRGAAAVGAIVYATAFAMPLVHATAQLEPGAWLPVIALGEVEILRGGRSRWIVMTGACAAMPVLAGGYQVSVYVAYALGLIAVAVILDERAHGRAVPLARIARLAAAALLALATAAPQMLPTLAWAAETMRQPKGLTDAQMMPFFVESDRWQRIVVFFFRMQASDFCFLSIPVIALGLFAMLRAGWLGFVLGAGAILAALFAITPMNGVLLPVLKAIPGFNMFRFPVRITMLTSFFTAGAAALGLDRLGTSVGGAGGHRRSLLEAAAILTVLVLLVLPHRNSRPLPWNSPDLVARDPRFFPGDTEPSSAYRGWVPGARVDLRTGQFTRQAMPEHVRVLQDYEPLSSRRLGTFLAAVTGTPPPMPDDLLPFTGTVSREAVMSRPDLLDLAAVRTIMTSQASAPPDAPPPGWRLVRRYGDFIWYDNARALPRAYVVDRARLVADEDGALAELVDRRVDLHREAVLAGEPTPAATALSDVADSVATPVRIALDEPERVVVEVDRARPGLLVLADAFAPGWRVTVDGAPRTLWQTNYLVRGVLVEPGDRRVEFRYRAPGFALGVALCAATWGGALGTMLWRKRRARPPGRRAAE